MQLPQNPNPDQPSILSLKISKNQQKKSKSSFTKTRDQTWGRRGGRNWWWGWKTLAKNR